MQSRRAEIESGGAGIFNKIVAEEVAKHFMHIEQVATAMECHKNTAGKRLRYDDPIYIIYDGQRLYQREDMDRIIAARKQREKDKVQVALKEKLERKRRPRKITGKAVDELYNAMKGKKYAKV